MLATLLWATGGGGGGMSLSGEASLDTPVEEMGDTGSGRSKVARRLAPSGGSINPCSISCTMESVRSLRGPWWRELTVAVATPRRASWSTEGVRIEGRQSVRIKGKKHYNKLFL